MKEEAQVFGQNTIRINANHLLAHSNTEASCEDSNEHKTESGKLSTLSPLNNRNRK